MKGDLRKVSAFGRKIGYTANGRRIEKYAWDSRFQESSRWDKQSLLFQTHKWTPSFECRRTEEWRWERKKLNETHRFPSLCPPNLLFPIQTATCLSQRPNERKYVFTSTSCWTAMAALLGFFSFAMGPLQMLKLFFILYWIDSVISYLSYVCIRKNVSY